MAMMPQDFIMAPRLAQAMVDALIGNEHVVTTAGAVTVAAGDGRVVINKAAPSATAITLPSVVSRSGLPLVIADFGGNGGDITITPNGSETVMGLSSATLISNAQGVGTAGSITLYPSTAANGWIA